MRKAGLFLSLLFFTSQLAAQSPSYLVAVSPWTNQLDLYDTSNYNIVNTLTLTAPLVVNGANGIAVHPKTHEMFIVWKDAPPNDRRLGILDPMTGTIEDKGDMGDRFAGIAFDNEGVLYGITGDGGNIPFTIYSIDTSNASTTYFATMGNGNDGETIGFCPENGALYHLSGLANQVYEKISLPDTNEVNIVMTGYDFSEAYSMLYLKDGKFLVADIGFEFIELDTAGFAVSTGFFSNDGVKGMSFMNCHTLWAEPNPLCDTINDSTLLVASHGTAYQWYRNGSPIAGATQQQYYSQVAGLYNCFITNAICGDDSAAIGINLLTPPVPVVNLTPDDTAYFCPGDSVLLTGTAAASSQWYFYGAPISGATNDSLYTSQPGLYNMETTNAQGCSDSAAVGVMLIEYIPPDPNIGPDTIVCVQWGYTLDAGPGVSYIWSTGATTQTITPTVGATFHVTVTDANGCTGTDTAIVVVNPCPGIEEGISSSVSILVYPNPTKDVVHLKVMGKSPSAVEAYDLLGMKVLHASGLGRIMDVDISSLPAGIYLLKVETPEGIATKKIVLER